MTQDRKPADADAPDELVPDSTVRRECGNLSAMGLHRWELDPELAFPPPVIVRGRKYRWRSQVEALKARLIEASESGEAQTAPPAHPYRKPAKTGGFVTG